MSPFEQQVLVRALAEIDVVFSPVRLTPGSQKMASAVCERVRRYRTGLGIPLAVSGSDSTRQSARRTLLALQRRGLVMLVGQGRNRGVALTTKGEALARSMTPTYRRDEVWRLISTLLDLHAAYETTGFIQEHDFARAYAPSKKDELPLLLLEDHALPFIVGGQIDCWSDTEGRLGYRITDAGFAALDSARPAAPKRLPRYNGELGELYTSAFLRGIKDRDAWQPVATNHVVVPLSCGNWPLRQETAADV